MREYSQQVDAKQMRNRAYWKTGMLSLQCFIPLDYLSLLYLSLHRLLICGSEIFRKARNVLRFRDTQAALHRIRWTLNKEPWYKLYNSQQLVAKQRRNPVWYVFCADHEWFETQRYPSSLSKMNTEHRNLYVFLSGMPRSSFWCYVFHFIDASEARISLLQFLQLTINSEATLSMAIPAAVICRCSVTLPWYSVSPGMWPSALSVVALRLVQFCVLSDPADLDRRDAQIPNLPPRCRRAGSGRPPLTFVLTKFAVLRRPSADFDPPPWAAPEARPPPAASPHEIGELKAGCRRSAPILLTSFLNSPLVLALRSPRHGPRASAAPCRLLEASAFFTFVFCSYYSPEHFFCMF
jgi:hypothetical protein